MIRGPGAAARPWSARRPLTPHPRTGAGDGFPRGWGLKAAPSAPAPEKQTKSRRPREILANGGARGWDPGFTPPSPGDASLAPCSFRCKMTTLPPGPVQPSGKHSWNPNAAPGPGPPPPTARCYTRPPKLLTSESLRWLRLNSRALPPGRRPPPARGAPGGGCAVDGGGGGGGWGCLLFMISGPGPPAACSILAAPHPRLNSRTVPVM